MIKLKKLFGNSESEAEDHPWTPTPSNSPDGLGFRTVYQLFPKIERQRDPSNYPDIKDDFFWQTFEKCKAYSLLSVEAFYNLYRSVEYLARNRVPGDFVECGVFLGGAILAISDFAHHFGIGDRQFFLYDTFAGFPAETKELDLRGNPVNFQKHPNFRGTVDSVIAQSLCAKEQFHIVEGMVEETLPRTKPSAISLLRLDTDYYESTRVELTELYPLLASGGVLIVDDYGLFQGARRATDEFLEKQAKKPLLIRINFSVRTGVKP
jgi:O-methyltransferase